MGSPKAIWDLPSTYEETHRPPRRTWQPIPVWSAWGWSRTSRTRSAFGDGETDALALLLLEIEHYGIRAAQVFFALWLTPLGYLAFRSRLFPKPLGIILVAATISYLADVAVAFLFPDLAGQIHSFFGIVPAIAEIWMLFYLLTVGVRSPRIAPHLPGASVSAPLSRR